MTAIRVTRGAISLSNSSHLPLKPYSKMRKPVALPPGPRQTIDEAGTDRVGDAREHDWHRAGRLQQRRHRRGATGEDNIWRKRDQFCRIFANALGIASAPAYVDADVAASVQPNCFSPREKRLEAGLDPIDASASVAGNKHADAPHPLRLLRPRRERPRGRRAAEQA